MTLVYDLETDVRYKQGLEKGKLEGWQEGEEKGRLKGKLEGWQEGEEKGRLKGLLEGIQLALDIKYGSAGLSFMDTISAIENIDKLEQVKELIRNSASVEDLKNMIG